jgi:hypothetical protein
MGSSVVSIAAGLRFFNGPGRRISGASTAVFDRRLRHRGLPHIARVGLPACARRQEFDYRSLVSS